MIVELQRHADDFGARAGGERGHDRAVDAAGHGDDDPCFAKVAMEAEIDLHWSFSGGSLPEFHPSELGRRSVGAVERDVLSRPESKFTAAGPASEIDAADLVAAFEAQLASARGDRRSAVARLLSAGPGWKEARDVIGGAFADPSLEEGLKDEKGS